MNEANEEFVERVANDVMCGSLLDLQTRIEFFRLPEIEARVRKAEIEGIEYPCGDLPKDEFLRLWQRTKQKPSPTKLDV